MKRPCLREGFSTGTAAAAAAYAAVLRLLGGAAPAVATVALPPFADGLPLFSGARQRLSVAVADSGAEPDGTAWAAVIKDGGDDPDATHGARIIVHASRQAPRVPREPLHGPVILSGGAPGHGPIHIYGGRGVGLVTLPGLPVAPGEPAINPEPRKQIACAALEAAERHAFPGPLHLLIRVPEGVTRAKRTMNARLGITGGISILGTRGTVRPFSHEAWKAAISQGISVAAALGLDTILFSTGRRSERLGFMLYPDLAARCGIQAADFVAFAIREAAGRGFARIVWCCFPGKLLKLAQGLEWTHAKSATADIAMLARYCADAGGDAGLTAGVAAMPTATGAFALMAQNPAIHAAVLRRIGNQAFAALLCWLREGCSGPGCPDLTLCVFSTEERLLLRLP